MSHKPQISERNIAVVLAAVFALAGIAMIVSAAHLSFERSKLLSRGIKAEGVIVGFERIGPGPEDQLKDKWLVPVVQFTTESGKTITTLGSTTEHWWTDYRNGDAVTVVYPPRDPESARIDTLAEIWFAPFMLCLVGAGAIFVPALTVWRYFRQKDKRLSS